MYDRKARKSKELLHARQETQTNPHDLGVGLDLENLKQALLQITTQLNQTASEIDINHVRQLDVIFENARKDIRNILANFRETLFQGQFIFELTAYQKETLHIKEWLDITYNYEQHIMNIVNAEYEFHKHNTVQKQYLAFNEYLRKTKINAGEPVNFKPIYTQIASLAESKNASFYTKAKTKLVEFVQNHVDSECARLLDNPHQTSPKEISKRFKNVNTFLTDMQSLEKKHFPELHGHTYVDLKTKFKISGQFIRKFNRQLDDILAVQHNKQNHQTLKESANALYEFSTHKIQKIGIFFGEAFQKTSAFFVNKINQLQVVLNNGSQTDLSNNFETWQATIFFFFNKNRVMTQEENKQNSNPHIEPKTKAIEDKPSSDTHPAIAEIIAFNAENNSTVAAGDEKAANNKILVFFEFLKKKYPDDVFSHVFSWMQGINDKYEKDISIKNNKEVFKDIVLKCHPDKIKQHFSFSDNELDLLLHSLCLNYANNFFTALTNSDDNHAILQRCNDLLAKIDKGIEEVRKQHQEIRQAHQELNQKIQEFEEIVQKDSHEFTLQCEEASQQMTQKCEELSQEMTLQRQDMTQQLNEYELATQETAEQVQALRQKIETGSKVFEKALDDKMKQLLDVFQKQRSTPSSETKEQPSGGYSAGFFQAAKPEYSKDSADITTPSLTLRLTPEFSTTSEVSPQSP